MSSSEDVAILKTWYEDYWLYSTLVNPSYQTGCDDINSADADASSFP